MLALTSSFIVIFVVIVVIIIAVLIYRKAYQNNMNRALDGENRSSLFEPGQFLMFAGFVMLAIFSIVSLNKINSLETQLYNVQNKLNDANNSLWYLNSELDDLQDDFEEYLQSQKLVNESSYQVISIPNENQLEYRIDFTLNEMETGADVSLVVVEGENQIIYPLNSSSLTYTQNVTLDNDKTYSFYTKVTGLSTKQELLFEVEVDCSFEGRFEVDLSGSWSTSDNFSDWNINIENSYIGSNDLLFNSITIYVYKNDILVDTIVETQKFTTFNDMELYSDDFRIDDYSESNSYHIVITIEDNSGNTYTKTMVIFDETDPEID